MNSKLAVVIPSHNNLDVLKSSIPAVYSDDYAIVVFDDGSSDGTKLWLQNNYPKIKVLSGDGSNWWTGSLAKLIDYCMDLGFEHIVSLNADVLISPKIVKDLLKKSQNHGDAIIGSVVVDINNPETILWAGSTFEKIHNLVPIYGSRYALKSGTHTNKLPEKIYKVDEIHGRGVLIPMSVLQMIGNFDYQTFPQYGGDTDFSLRAKSNGVEMFVDPSCVARVFAQNTSLNKKERLSFGKKLLSIKHYLFDRKNGEALNVWWNLYKKHLPYAYLLQSFVFVILLNVYRKLIS